MAKRNSSKRAKKHFAGFISVLLVLVLLFAINYFLNDPVGLFGNHGSASPDIVELPVVTEDSQPSSPSSGTLDVYMIDVGQGDAIFLRSPSGKTMLIDAYDFNAVDAFLKSQNVKRIDVVIATHPHLDHIKGMRKVLLNYDIGTYYMPEAVSTSSTYEKLLDTLESKNIKTVKASGGNTIKWDSDTKVKVLSPLKDTPTNNLNNTSIVCRIQYGKTAVMLTGDAEADAEKCELKKFSSSSLAADVLKVGHHGSVSSSSDDFLDAVNPSVALISVGEGNDYGHPHQETLKKFSDRGIKVYRTDLNGSIHVTLDGSKVKVKTEK